MSMPGTSPAGTTFTIADLARLADVTPRTVRYYVAQGLLRPPGHAGPGARYPESALSRLRLIRELQRSHLPLAEIRTRLAGLTDAEVDGLVVPPSPAPSETAIDYIRGLIGQRPVGQYPVGAARLAQPPAAAAIAAPAEAIAAGSGTSPGSAPGAERSQWDRISLTPDVELHIRRPLGRLEQRRVERLITIARQVLKEETP
jgi:DNA-binding transcriptional MerR regulator